MKDYELILFDCDGVILNSNKIKSEAFFKVASKFSVDSADELVDYNKTHGGVSRYKKFQHYAETILPKYEEINLKESELLKKFGDVVCEALLNCEMSPYLSGLRDEFKNSNWAVVSGGDQDELRYVFNERKISHFFKKGIWGSPSNKYEIIKNNFENYLKSKVLYLGDSELDYDVAEYFNFDFIFISDWTELSNWKKFVAKNSINSIGNIGMLINET